MCLKTKMKEPVITKKPITCYKVICKDMSSLLHPNFKWEFGKLYETEMKPTDNSWIDDTIINEGFHSYKSYKDVKAGYFMANSPCMIVECTIPKGATFYGGYHGGEQGFVSNQIIINKVLDIKKVFKNFPWNQYPYKEGQLIKIVYDDGTTYVRKIENIQPATKTSDVFLLTDGPSYGTYRNGQPIALFYTIEKIEPSNE